MAPVPLPFLPVPDFTTFLVFFSAASVLAITPGLGIFYMMTRSLKGGRVEGIASAMSYVALTGEGE